jgi:SAM-dependent methyltransferase
MGLCWKWIDPRGEDSATNQPMNRLVEPEFLDQLPPTDRGAMASRRDLQKVNFWMGHAGIMDHALSTAFAGRSPQSIVDLGGGDGTFLLQLARRMASRWKGVHAVVVDRRGLLSARTREEFAALSWRVESLEADIFDFLQRPAPRRFDVTIASLFLHHFLRDDLQRLLSGAATHTEFFLACEPHRAPFALRAAGLLWVIGCNRVTLHDAQVSVRAGFLGKELSALWPADGCWQLSERKAGQFTHCFTAQRSIVSIGESANGHATL